MRSQLVLNNSYWNQFLPWPHSNINWHHQITYKQCFSCHNVERNHPFTGRLLKNLEQRVSLQVRNDLRTNPEPILYLFRAEPILNQFWTNLMAWCVRPPFGYGSHTYVRIRSYILTHMYIRIWTNGEPIKTKKSFYVQNWFRPEQITLVQDWFSVCTVPAG